MPQPVQKEINFQGTIQIYENSLNGMVEVGALVAKLSQVAEYQETMGKTLRDVELLLVVGGKLHAEPLAVGVTVAS